MNQTNNNQNLNNPQDISNPSDSINSDGNVSNDLNQGASEGSQHAYPNQNAPMGQPAQQYPQQNQQNPVSDQHQYPQQQYPYPAQQAPQYSQPVSGSGSPEVPATRIESGGEYVQNVESAPTLEDQEQIREKGDEKSKDDDKKQIKAPEKAPEQKKFESPFNVYGYKIPQKIKNLKSKMKGDKPKGDVNVAKTWLFVLLGRLLKMSQPEK